MKILLLLLAAAAAAAPPTRMTLKNGTVYALSAPPRLVGSRLVFTTVEGKVFSIDEKEVDSIGALSTPTPTPRGLNPLDSHALGAIVRRHRARTGKTVLIAPRPDGAAKPAPMAPSKRRPR